MNLDEAIRKHVAWKLKFRTAIMKGETLDTENIAKDDKCELGKWLHHEGRIQYGSRPEFKVLEETHRKFHVEAGKLSDAINQKRYEHATKALESEYHAISTKVVSAINALNAVSQID